MIISPVATALTVYGIETPDVIFFWMFWLNVATALTVYGIETIMMSMMVLVMYIMVATALTVYGIETSSAW